MAEIHWKDVQFGDQFAELGKMLCYQVDPKENLNGWLMPKEASETYDVVIGFNIENDDDLIGIENTTAMDISTHEMNESCILFPPEDEFDTTIEELHCALHHHELKNVLEVLNHLPFNKVDDACTRINLKDLDNDLLMQFTHEMRNCQICLSHKTTVAIITHLFKDKICVLDKPLPRVQLLSLIQLASYYTSQVIELLVEVIQIQNIGTSQYDLIVRIVKEAFNDEHKEQLLRSVLKVEFYWSEEMINLLQCLLQSNMNVDNDLIGDLLHSLQRTGTTFSKNLKFGRLLQHILLKYEPVLNNQCEILLDNLIAHHETFMKKSLKKQFEKIQKNKTLL